MKRLYHPDRHFIEPGMYFDTWLVQIESKHRIQMDDESVDIDRFAEMRLPTLDFSEFTPREKQAALYLIECFASEAAMGWHDNIASGLCMMPTWGFAKYGDDFMLHGGIHKWMWTWINRIVALTPEDIKTWAPDALQARNKIGKAITNSIGGHTYLTSWAANFEPIFIDYLCHIGVKDLRVPYQIAPIVREGLRVVWLDRIVENLTPLVEAA